MRSPIGSRTSLVGSRWRRASGIIVAFIIALVVQGANSKAFACAACFGQSDSSMAKSLNAGIFSLMAVIVTILAAAASFFVFLAKKAASTPEESDDDAPHSNLES